MPVETLLMLVDDVEISFEIRGIATNGDWQHDPLLRSQARTIAERLLAGSGAKPGEGWSIVLGVDGKATMSQRR